MTNSTLVIVAIVALIVTGLTATAVRVLREFSRRELKIYARRRKRSDRFREILDQDEQAALGLESLQIVAVVTLIVAMTLLALRSINESAFGPAHFVIVAVVGSVILLALTAWIPTAVSQLWPAPFVFHSWLLLKWSSRIVWPLTLGVEVVGALMRRLADRPEDDEDEEEAFEDEIRSIVTEGLHEGVLDREEQEMIEGVIELGDADVSDIMTSRRDIDALAVDLDQREVLTFASDAGRTRIPVYEETLDNVVGVLYVKDLLQEFAKPDGEPQRSVRELLRDAVFVPKTKPLDELLQEFLHTRTHLAIVVDEYESVAGVVTIEDVLEEIVGEIIDESDKEEAAHFKRIDDSTVEVQGRVHINVVNDLLGIDLSDPDEYDTIAGLVVVKLGRIPKPGDSVVVEGARITVLDSSRRRAERLRVELAPAVGAESA